MGDDMDSCSGTIVVFVWNKLNMY